MQIGGFDEPEDFFDDEVQTDQWVEGARTQSFFAALTTRRLVVMLMVTALLSGAIGYEIGRQGGRNLLGADRVLTAQPAMPSAAPAPVPRPVAPKPSDPLVPSPSLGKTLSPAPSTPSPDSSVQAATLSTQGYLDLLATLEIKGRAPKTGYDRLEFGEAWLDVDGNSCDTRNDILLRDLTDVTFRTGSGGCTVESGRLDDPYTGTVIDFQRGSDTSVLVQIDHLVPLADAWVKGAQQWTSSERVAFANDPRNLLAVDGAANQQKGAGDAATWLPKNRSFWCEYAARIVVVKAAYGVWTTQAENDRLGQLLADCSR